MTFLLMWVSFGFLGWCAFMAKALLEDGLPAVLKRSVKDWYFTVPFLVVCVAMGLFTVVFASFVTWTLPRS